jgi:hypothetical protein
MENTPGFFNLFGIERYNTTDAIDIIDRFGETWRIMGPGEGAQGVWLAPRSSGLFDMPFKTNWGNGLFGQRFKSWKPERRDIVWTVYIANPDDIMTGIEDDPDTWHHIYSRWRAGVSPAHEITICYHSIDGERRMKVRPLQTAKSVSTLDFEGNDPHIWRFGSVVMTMAAELPFYVGPRESYEYQWDGTGTHWFRLPYYNPGTVEIWPEWELSAESRFWLPDYSFGCEEYGRGPEDEGKTLRLPYTRAGADLSVYSRPDMETLVAADDTPMNALLAGKDLEYPIPPGAGDPENGCVIMVDQIKDGFSLRLHMDRWYEDPFSTPLVVAA